MQFYLSDQPNAIDDFEHLNVTVSKVGFRRAGTANGSNETNGSNDTDAPGWTEVDVDDRTVDLTRLKGENATLLSRFELGAGEYTKVFIHVTEVNGTLTDGSGAEVELPSDKLQLNQDFRVEANQSVDFVYDIAVVKRGNSGSYNVKPNAGQSGTDVPVRKVEADGDEATDLSARFVGTVARGENATVSVTSNGSAVENASVAVEQLNETATTNENGTVTFQVPDNASKVEVTVTHEGATVELERELDEDGETEGQGEAQSLTRPV